MIDIADSARAEQLRDELINQLRDLGAVRTEAVATAVRTVPRHMFVPEATLEQAYQAERAEVIKRDGHGVALSSVSAARIQTFMLEQADIRPGMRVLEIGSGGYNAALIAELVGEDGEVTTIDIDPDVVDRARHLLQAAGYGQVTVVLADGEGGEPDHAPYDRIVVTADAADIANTWADQLVEDGRLVVPLRIRGLTRSIAFQRESGHLASQGYELWTVPRKRRLDDWAPAYGSRHSIHRLSRRIALGHGRPAAGTRSNRDCSLRTGLTSGTLTALRDPRPVRRPVVGASRKSVSGPRQDIRQRAGQGGNSS